MHMLLEVVVYSFLLAYIPLNEYTTMYLTIVLLTSIWIT